MYIDKPLWNRIQDHFDQLIGLAAEERDSYLDRSGLPDADRAVLLELLAAGPECELLDRPVPDLLALGSQETQSPPPPHDWHGRELGPWRVDRLISRGGMGAVYAGYRNDGRFDKKVAIKLLDAAGLDSAEHKRLIEEVRILARLQHPGIAQLIDSGVSGDGYSWLVMEYVDGQPIDRYCREREIGLEQRIELVCQVAEALEYAHRHQIVHCDIKPANILVSESGRAQLVDFGIARLVQDRAQGESDGRIYCSPGFTAPERLRGAAPTTMHDVYALGALLHVLATGQRVSLPATAGVEPPLPSGLNRRKSARQSGQRSGARRFGIDHDLQAICRRAMAINPDQRYRSVESMRTDLSNWMEHRPVAARNGGRLYWLGCFVRRNTLATALGVGLVAALLAGLFAAQWQAQEAMREAQRKTAALGYLQDVLATLVPDSPDAVAEPRTRVLLRATEQAPRALADEPLVLAQVSETMAGLLARIGEYEAAQYAQQRAAGLYLAEHGPDHPDTVLARTEQLRLRATRGGVSDPAVEQALRDAIAVTRDRPAYRRRHALSLTQLATLLGNVGRTDEALVVVNQARAFLQADDPLQQRVETDLIAAELNITNGTHETALELIQTHEAELRETLGAGHRLSLTLAGVRGQALRYAGRLEESREHLTTAIDGLRPLYPEGNERLLDLLGGLGIAHYKLGELDPAAEVAREHLDLSRRLLGGRSHQTALALSNTGNIEFARGNYPAARDLQEESAQAFAELYGEDHIAVALTLGNMAEALHHMGRHAQSMELRIGAMQRIGEVWGEDSMRYLHQLRARARTQLAMGQADEAAMALERTLSLAEATDSRQSEEMALTRAWLAEARRQQGRTEEARRLLTAARSGLDQSGEATPAMQETVARLEARLACHLSALDACRQAVESADGLYARRLPVDSPIRAELRQLLAAAQARHGSG